MRKLFLFSILVFVKSLTAEATPALSPRQVNPEPKLTEQQVVKLLQNAGFKQKDIPVMVCTAKHESAFDPQALNVNRDKSIDYGLFQINGRWWSKECNLNKLLDAQYNTYCAKIVFDKQGINAWWGYKRNKTECDNYKVN